MRRIAGLGAFAGLVLLAACAKMAPPPGGPVDEEPPVVRRDDLLPPLGAFGVAPDSTLRIVFSERVNERSVMRSLRVIPPVTFAQVSWSRDTLRLVPEDGWAEGRPTLVRLTEDARDSRGNRMREAFQTSFTTQAVADSGTIRGVAWAGREFTDGKKLYVLAWSAAPRAEGEDEERWPVALEEVQSGRPFTLAGLDTGERYWVAGLIDTNDDFESDGSDDEVETRWDAAVAFPDSLTSVQLPDLLIGTLDSLGTVSGEVQADSARVAFVVARRAPAELTAPGSDAPPAPEAGESTESEEAAAPGVDADSTIAPPPAWLATAGWKSDPVRGSYSLSLPTGEDYQLAAFVDVDGDSAVGPDEPAIVLPEIVSLRFEPKSDGVRFDLRGLAPWPVDTTAAANDTTATEPEEEGEAGELESDE